MSLRNNALNLAKIRARKTILSSAQRIVGRLGQKLALLGLIN
jgi:hypothetical protein